MSAGLVENGVAVSVLNLCHRQEEYDQFMHDYGEKINYSFDPGCSGALYKGRNKVAKLLNNIWITWKFSWRLLTLFLTSKINSVILSRGSIEITLPAILFCKIFRVPLIANIMEYGPAMPSYSMDLLARIQWRLITRFSNAFILISRYLMDKLGSKKPAMYLPVICEKRIEKGTHQNGWAKEMLQDSGIPCGPFPLLIYLSSKEYQDLLEFCIDSLSRVKDDYCLIITANYSENEKARLRRKIQSFKFEGKIKFAGFLKADELLLLQKKSRALLMPLKDVDRDRARFPQKILHYMSLGKPVVTTNVGEIKEHFKNGVNAFIDETISTSGYAKTISCFLQNERIAYRVGENAAQFVEERFDYIYWTRELKEFIYTIGQKQSINCRRSTS